MMVTSTMLNNGMPDSFCPSTQGIRKLISSQDAVINTLPPDQYESEYPNGMYWAKTSLPEYKKSETFVIQRAADKMEPFFLFYKLNKIACLPKDADLDAFNKVEDLGPNIEVFDSKVVYQVNRQLDVIMDKIGYGNMMPKEIDQILKDRGFMKQVI